MQAVPWQSQRGSVSPVPTRSSRVYGGVGGDSPTGSLLELLPPSFEPPRLLPVDTAAVKGSGGLSPGDVSLAAFGTPAPRRSDGGGGGGGAVWGDGVTMGPSPTRGGARSPTLPPIAGGIDGGLGSMGNGMAVGSIGVSVARSGMPTEVGMSAQAPASDEASSGASLSVEQLSAQASWFFVQPSVASLLQPSAGTGTVAGTGASTSASASGAVVSRPRTSGGSSAGRGNSGVAHKGHQVGGGGRVAIASRSSVQQWPHAQAAGTPAASVSPAVWTVTGVPLTSPMALPARPNTSGGHSVSASAANAVGSSSASLSPLRSDAALASSGATSLAVSGSSAGAAGTTTSPGVRSRRLHPLPDDVAARANAAAARTSTAVDVLTLSSDSVYVMDSLYSPSVVGSSGAAAGYVTFSGGSAALSPSHGAGSGLSGGGSIGAPPTSPLMLGSPLLGPGRRRKAATPLHATPVLRGSASGGSASSDAVGESSPSVTSVAGAGSAGGHSGLRQGVVARGFSNNLGDRPAPPAVSSGAFTNACYV